MNEVWLNKTPILSSSFVRFCEWRIFVSLFTSHTSTLLCELKPETVSAFALEWNVSGWIICTYKKYECERARQRERKITIKMEAERISSLYGNGSLVVWIMCQICREIQFLFFLIRFFSAFKRIHMNVWLRLEKLCFVIFYELWLYSFLAFFFFIFIVAYMGFLFFFNSSSRKRRANKYTCEIDIYIVYCSNVVSLHRFLKHKFHVSFDISTTHARLNVIRASWNLYILIDFLFICNKYNLRVHTLTHSIPDAWLAKHINDWLTDHAEEATNADLLSNLCNLSWTLWSQASQVSLICNWI